MWTELSTLRRLLVIPGRTLSQSGFLYSLLWEHEASPSEPDLFPALTLHADGTSLVSSCPHTPTCRLAAAGLPSLSLSKIRIPETSVRYGTP